MSFETFPKPTLRWANAISSMLYEAVKARTNKEEITLEKTKSILGDTLGGAIDDLLSKKTVIPNNLSSLEKKAIAEGMFYGLHYKYGFDDQLETDNWNPWPDEITMVTCYSQSIANYIIAKNCNLNPTLVEFVGLQGDSSFRVGHSLIVVDVGDIGKPELWIVDQPMNMYGPVTITENTMIVNDLAAEQGRIHKKDFRKKVFDFIINIASDEGRIVNNIENLRAHPEAVLYTGQRLSTPTIDSWQSEEPLHAPWYLKFITDETGNTRGKIVSRIILERPGIKSRGLEYKITIGKDNRIQDETLLGYYCSTNVWADFMDGVPLVSIPLHNAKKLVAGLAEMPIKEHAAFEVELMKKSYSGENDDRIQAAAESFKTLRESEYGGIVTAMVAVEAIYQHDKGSKNHYLTVGEREEAIKRLKSRHYFIEYYSKVKKELQRGESIVKRKAEIKRRIQLLQPNQIEDQSTRLFLSLQNEQERLQHLLEHRPTYFDDAIDRLVFYDRRIKSRENKVLNIAKDMFGENYDRALFSAYTRIFGEFLGHFSVTFPYVTLEKYKEKIVRKITSIY